MYLLLGGISSFATLYNIFLFQFGLFKCCSHVVSDVFYFYIAYHNCYRKSAGICLGNLMAFITIFVQFLSFLVICILFIAYFPRELKYITTPPANHTSGSGMHNSGRSGGGGAGGSVESGRRTRSHQWTNALIMAYSLTAFALAAGLVAVGLLAGVGDGKHSAKTKLYADSLGLFSTALSFVQFLPQIISTLRSRVIGALSIPSMMIQSPGSFLMAYFVAAGEGTKVSTWLPYVASGSLQAVLLCIALTWHFKAKWADRHHDLNDDDAGGDSGDGGEKQPLLASQTENVDIGDNPLAGEKLEVNSPPSIPVQIPEPRGQRKSLTPASLSQFMGANFKSTSVSSNYSGKTRCSHQHNPVISGQHK